MSIESIELKDFQRHKRLKIQLSSTITTIKGPTDAGKSSILRALRWCCLNDFAGDEFVREGADSTEVIIRVNGKKITRAKAARKNTYALEDEEYKAFGISGVPAPIAAVLRLSILNFQDQHDAPFWFSETAGEVSRQLNSVIDLSVIDTSLAHAFQNVRHAQGRVSYCKERLAQSEKEFEEVKSQRLRVSEFNRLQSLFDKCRAAVDRHYALGYLMEEYSRISAVQLRKRAEEAEELFGLAKRTVSLERKVERLKSLLEDFGRHNKVGAPPPDFSEVSETHQSVLNLQSEISILEALLQMVRQYEEHLSGSQERVRRAEIIFHEKTRGEKCPLCGNQIQ